MEVISIEAFDVSLVEQLLRRILSLWRGERLAIVKFAAVVYTDIHAERSKGWMEEERKKRETERGREDRKEENVARFFSFK